MLSSRIWNSQIFTDFTGKLIVNLSMPWHCTSGIQYRITPPRVVTTFSNHIATVPFEMPDQGSSFHTRIATS